MLDKIFIQLKELCGGNSISRKDLENLMVSDYEYLIDLRNRIANGTDNDTTLYEEDHLALDHILDYMEIFIKIIKGEL